MPSKYTPEEDQKLRELFARGDSIVKNLDLFPGRSHDSLICRAQRLGINHAKFAAWTKKEDKILKEIWMAPRYLKEGMHRIPRHSYEAAKTRALRLKLGKKTAPTQGNRSYVHLAIKEILKDISDVSMRDLALKTGVSESSVGHILARYRGVDFYVSSWEYASPNHPVMKWSLGTGPDEPKPAAKGKKMRKERRRIANGDFNPFATAAGMVNAPQTTVGRVHQIMDEEMEAA